MPDLVVTPESLRIQCLTLKRHYDILPLHEAVEAFLSGRPTRRPLAAVTFDDGYQDNFHHAAPVLMETDVRATFFVITDLVGAVRSPWYDRIARSMLAINQRWKVDDVFAEYGIHTAVDSPQKDNARQIVAQAKRMTPDKRRRFVSLLCEIAGDNESSRPDDLIMDWDQLVQLAYYGHEIGSHGAAHEILPQLDDQPLESEIAGSRRTLEARLSRPVWSFCYPNGNVDDRVARAVQAAGYRCAVTVESGSNARQVDAYHLKRWFIHEDRLSGLGGQTSDVLLRMELCGLADRVFRRRR